MALLRHSGIYFGARLVTGGAGFILIAAYTRLFDTEQFGELALALSAVGFFNLVVMDGVMLALLRYQPSNDAAARATALWGLILPVAGLCAIVAAVSFMLPFGPWRAQIALCAGLLIATFLHRFQLTSSQAALRPAVYALLTAL